MQTKRKCFHLSYFFSSQFGCFSAKSAFHLNAEMQHVSHWKVLINSDGVFWEGIRLAFKNLLMSLGLFFSSDSMISLMSGFGLPVPAHMEIGCCTF